MLWPINIRRVRGKNMWGNSAQIVKVTKHISESRGLIICVESAVISLSERQRKNKEVRYEVRRHVQTSG